MLSPQMKQLSLEQLRTLDMCSRCVQWPFMHVYTCTCSKALAYFIAYLEHLHLDVCYNVLSNLRVVHHLISQFITFTLTKR